MIWTDLGSLVPFAILRAHRQTYDGTVNDRNMRLMSRCRHVFAINSVTSATLIYTRDVGHHTSGWWKNPDYERCRHLSIAFFAGALSAPLPLPFNRKEAQRIAEAFFREDTRKCWIEPPYSPEGKRADVHHYRLFCDPSWTPMIPRGEVYSREQMPFGWKSFSEIHGWSPTEENAPWLKAVSE